MLMAVTSELEEGLLKSGAQTLSNPWSSADKVVISVPDSRFPVLRSSFPFLAPRSPFPVPRFSFSVSRSPFPVPRSPFPVPHSPFLILRSSFSVPRSPFLVLRSSFSVLRSSFSVPHSPLPALSLPFLVPRYSIFVARTLFFVEVTSHHWRYNSGQFKQRFPKYHSAVRVLIGKKNIWILRSILDRKKLQTGSYPAEFTGQL